MRSKYFFDEFKDQIKEEHEKFETHLENRDISQDRCNHKGKVKMVNGMLRCSCGAGWQGPGLDTLFDLLNK
jgi:hypothetical protein